MSSAMETTNVSRRTLIGGAALGAAALGMVGVAGVACADESAAADSAAGGSVTASATLPGYGGDVTVTLTVDTASGTVTDAVIEGAAETPERGGRAISVMQEQIISTGSIDTDMVAGATVTSSAIMDASAIAYNEAMGISVSTSVKMAPGKYTGAAKGYWQIWDLPVTITVNETAILKIEVPDDRFEHGETEVILQSVKDLLFPRIIENQSIAVDAIAGATSTSNAVKLAIKQALQQALEAGGSDPAAVTAFQNPPAKPRSANPRPSTPTSSSSAWAMAASWP